MVPRDQSDGQGARARRRRGEGGRIGGALRLCRRAPPEANLAPPLGDPARGRYLHWLFFAAGCIEAAYTQKFTNLALPGGEVSAGWGSFEKVMDVLEQAVTPGPWLLGERFSAADIMIGADLYFGLNLLKIVPPRPAIAAYVGRCAARPAFQRAQAIDAGAGA